MTNRPVPKLRPLIRLLRILTLAVATSGAAVAQSGWALQPAPTNGDLITVFFTSSERGWIAGDDGFLAETTDAGKTWKKYDLGTDEAINEIYFRNDDNGYLVAGRRMFITHDKGRTWRDLQIYRSGEFGAGRPEFLSIRFSDKNRGYVIGSVLRKSGNDEVVVDSLLMRTEDGGETWRRISVPTKTELFHLDFSGNSHGWIVGDGGLIFHSTDEGLTWRQQNSGTSQPLYHVDFRNDDQGYVVGKSGLILRTENGGATWDSVLTSAKETFMRVDFPEDKQGWIVGYGGTILRSENRGQTWTRQDSFVRSRIYGLFMEKKYGWAVGEKGLVLRYKK